MDKTNFLYPVLIGSLSAIIFLSLTSCGPSKEECEAEQARKIKTGEVIGEYKVKVIDGCEYLTAGYVPAPWHVITHKGNCKNPFHQIK